MQLKIMDAKNETTVAVKIAESKNPILSFQLGVS